MILDLYIDTARRKLVGGPLSSATITPPVLSQGNTITFKIHCLKPVANFPNASPPFEPIQTSGLGIQFAIGTKSGTTSIHYVEQYTWAEGGDVTDPYFTATVAMNTDGIATLLGTDPRKSTATLEINLVEGGTPGTIFSETVTVEASVIKSDAITVPTGFTPLSAEAALTSFLSFIISKPFTIVCPTDPTVKVSAYLGTDGAMHYDPIA